ncbi:MAG: MFS transporter, partial [Terriglobus roseus]|nr:MFS transporter [Terriglobus roseus]
MSGGGSGSHRPSAADRRKSSTLHYQTFPTKPPTSKGRPPSLSPNPPSRSTGDGRDSQSPNGSEGSAPHDESPLPLKQLVVLAVVALAEQTALNSISPYLPKMAASFPEVDEGQVGLYVGLIASSFALAQFATNFFWGYLSDKIGRKPVILTGTLLTAACFVAFGFCRTLWQAIVVQVLMGLVNGNQGVVSTCLGEITDRSNQSKAFTYLPVVYGIGGITGPIVGGLLVYQETADGRPNPYPYLFPNLFSAAVLVVDLIITSIFLEESLEEAKDLPPWGKRLGNIFTWLWQFAGFSHSPTYTRRRGGGKRPGTSSSHGRASLDGSAGAGGDTTDDDQADAPSLLPSTAADTLRKSEVFQRDTLLLLITYFIFQLSNISYNSLYPIFGEAPPPTGRNLTEEEVGISLAFAGAVTILFQIGIYGKLRDRIGNKTTYRVSLATFVVTFFLTPFVGYKQGDKGPSGPGNAKAWLWIELGVVLVLKTVAAVGGLTSALLLVSSAGRGILT